MQSILDFIGENLISITFLVTLIGGLFKFWQYVDLRRRELKQQDFENYHKIIERLTTPVWSSDNVPYLNIQQAAVFELRNYPEYKEVTKNIFQRWIKNDSALTEEMKSTLNYLKILDK